MTDTVKIQIRVTSGEKWRWKLLAEKAGMTLTDYIKMKVNEGVMTLEENDYGPVMTYGEQRTDYIKEKMNEGVMTKEERGKEEFKTYLNKEEVKK